ncbi:MAG TPA: hypothetical protein VH279_00635 [Solirubrobacteraceae bacterium]|nr:hypothetical protein [Solirubrobacteraceae bacterium]
MAQVLLVATAGVGCGRQVASSAAPPTVVCDTTLNDSAAGAVIVDATHDHGPVVSPTIQGLLYFKVSDLCSRGTRVTWTPAKAATLVKRAASKDGLDAAVVLRPMSRTAHFTLSAKRDGAIVAYASVRLRRGG